MPSPAAPAVRAAASTPRCPHARERCRHDRPALEPAGEGRRAACHFWREIRNAGAGPARGATDDAPSAALARRLALFEAAAAVSGPATVKKEEDVDDHAICPPALLATLASTARLGPDAPHRPRRTTPTSSIRTRPAPSSAASSSPSLCDKLVDVTPELNFVPQLATAWSTSDDGKTLTFKLRDGVTFHDGDAARRRCRQGQHRPRPLACPTPSARASSPRWSRSRSWTR